MLEAYKIGVELAIKDSFSSALALFGSKLTGIHAKVGEIEAGIGKWGRAIAGVAGVMAGSALFKGLETIAKHGEELLHQQNALERAQGKSVGLAEAHRRAVELTADAYNKILPKIPTATASDYIRTVNELYTVTGSYEAAKASAPMSLKLESLVGNATGKDAAGQGFQVWRAAENKGVTQDEAATDKLFGILSQDIIGSGGKITGEGIFNFSKYAGAAWKLANERALTGGIPYAIAELGGASAGTGTQRMYNTIQGTRRWTRQQYDEWRRLGLIDPSHVEGDLGGKLNLKPGAVRGGLDYSGDMEGYVNQVIRPAFEKAGIKDPAMVNAELAKMFPDSTAARLAQTYYQQQQNIEKDRANYAGALPLGEAYQHMIDHDPKAIMEAFNKQFEALLQALGGPLMQAAIPAMKMLTEAFTSMGQFANEHPQAIKLIGETLAGVAVALIGLGAISLATLGGIPLAIAAAVGAIGALVAFNWDKIAAGASSVVAGLESVANAIANFVKTVWEKVEHFFRGSGIGKDANPTAPDAPGRASPMIFPGDSTPQIRPTFIDSRTTTIHPTSTDSRQTTIRPILADFRGYPQQQDQKPITLAATLNIDGTQLAQTIAPKLANLYENSPNSPASNDLAHLDLNGGLAG
jgi:hypothetical protein